MRHPSSFGMADSKLPLWLAVLVLVGLYFILDKALPEEKFQPTTITF